MGEPTNIPADVDLSFKRYDPTRQQWFTNNEPDAPAYDNLDFQETFDTDLSLPDTQRREKELVTFEGRENLQLAASLKFGWNIPPKDIVLREFLRQAQVGDVWKMRDSGEIEMPYPYLKVERVTPEGINYRLAEDTQNFSEGGDIAALPGMGKDSPAGISFTLIFRDGFEVESAKKDKLFVCFWLPKKVREKFDFAAGDQDEPHMTLVYAKDAPADEASKKKVVQAIAKVVAAYDPIKCKFTGIGIMGNGDDTHVALVNCVEGAHLYNDIVEAIEKAWKPFDRKYGYLPHVTLQYEGTGKTNIDKLEPFEWTAKHVSVKFGDEEQYLLQLGSGEVEETLKQIASMNRQSWADTQTHLHLRYHENADAFTALYNEENLDRDDLLDWDNWEEYVRDYVIQKPLRKALPRLRVPIEVKSNERLTRNNNNLIYADIVITAPSSMLDNILRAFKADFEDGSMEQIKTASLKLGAPETYTDASDINEDLNTHNQKFEEFQQQDHLDVAIPQVKVPGEAEYMYMEDPGLRVKLDGDRGYANVAQAALKFSWEDFFQVGDTVKIVRKLYGNVSLWDNNDEMGNVGEIREIHDYDMHARHALPNAIPFPRGELIYTVVGKYGEGNWSWTCTEGELEKVNGPKKVAMDLPRAEEYGLEDLVLDPQPEEKVRNEKQQGNRDMYYEKGLHDNADNPGASRTLTPFGKLAFDSSGTPEGEAQILQDQGAPQENQPQNNPPVPQEPEEVDDVSFVYPDVDEIVDLHDEIIHVFGGASGVLPGGAERLDAAIGRMQSGFGGQEFYPSLIEKAAVLMHSIITTHPFSDGNKRTALASGAKFLHMNGMILHDSDEMAEKVLMVAEDKMNERDLITWLQKHTRDFLHHHQKTLRRLSR